MFVRNSGAGNGCVNFMDAWKNAFFLQEKKTQVHKIPRFRGGGYFGFWWGEGGVPILFLWARGFFWPLPPALECGMTGNPPKSWGWGPGGRAAKGRFFSKRPLWQHPCQHPTRIRKILLSVKLFVRNSGVGNNLLQKTFRYLLRFAFSWLFRGFFVAFSWPSSV